MTPTTPRGTLRLALPKGRMQDEVFALLADAGLRVRPSSRGYRPAISLPDCEVKLLKPQNIIEMLDAGSRDIGFAGADWVAELGASVVELLDTGLDPVRIVAAAPSALLRDGRLPPGPLVVASEYERITAEWIRRRDLDATCIRSYGATEVFPPEDADVIVDCTATGATLEANDLVIVDELMRSTTRLFANRAALDDSERRQAIDRVVLLLQSVLDARRRVMLEVNVTADRLDAVCAALPCMREPTISSLHGGAGYAVKAAVPRADLPQLIPRVKACGGTDIVVTLLSQIVA
ncbi:MAG: ATP phosphoribosyltransferase [Bacteroidales bacterium]